MKILALEKEVPGVTEDAFKPYHKEEAARMWGLYQAGIFRELYFRQDEPSAVMILECADVEEAKGFLNTLPLVREGLITFDVTTLVPYPGLARLFGD